MESVMKKDFWRNFNMGEKVIQIIENLTGYKKLKENRDIDLLENEIFDSLAFIELIATLNEEFDIEIQPTQVDPNTWRNIKKISDLVKSLQEEKC